jgi:small-conductance mechanosensitive channel
VESLLLKAAPLPSWIPIPDWLAPLLKHRFLGEDLLTWALSALTFLATYTFVRGVVAFASRKLEKVAVRTATGLDDIVVAVLRGTGRYSSLALSLYLATRNLDLKPGLEKLLHLLLVVAFTVQIGVWIDRAASKGISLWRGVHDSAQDATLAAGMRFAVRIFTFLILFLVALSNLGIEVGAMMAGLGVGGVAAALAVQNILGDLFAGVSMFFDRPFDIGDFITAGDLRGRVQRIGLRTTRITSLDGEQIVVPNGDLVKSRIKNYARMQERRMVLTFSVEYSTKAADLIRARDIAIATIQGVPGARLDRLHFRNLGESGIEYEGIFFVESADMTLAMDIQQTILFEIYRAFENAGIIFAFPSRTVYVKPDAAVLPMLGEFSDPSRPSSKQA